MADRDREGVSVQAKLWAIHKHDAERYFRSVGPVYQVALMPDWRDSPGMMPSGAPPTGQLFEFTREVRAVPFGQPRPWRVRCGSVIVEEGFDPPEELGFPVVRTRIYRDGN